MTGSSWASFPPELLLNVFNLLNFSDKPTCRLVCKAWDPVAEQASLASLCSSKKKPFLNLYDYLTKKPLTARHIKSLCLLGLDSEYDSEEIDTTYIQKLFQLLITPHITSITGNYNKEAIALLWEIIEDSPTPFDNIKELPIQRRYSKDYCEKFFFYDETYLQLLLHCKDTLESPTIQINPEPGMLDDMIEVLDEFLHLTSLTIRFQRCYSYMEDVEDIMQQCQGIKELYLDTDQTPRVMSSSKAQAKKWMREAKVEKCHSVKKIEDCLGTADLVEYYTYKFPSLGDLSLYCSLESSDSHVKRILDATKHVNKLDLNRIHLEELSVIQYFVTSMRGPQSKFQLFITPFDMFNYSAKMEGTRDLQTGESSIAMTIAMYQEPANLKKLVSCLDKVSELSVHLSNKLEEGDRCNFYGSDLEEPVELQTVLRLLPHVEKLYFKVDRIQSRSTDTKKASLNKLHTLTLKDAKMKQGILDFIQRSAPHLSNLTLNNCLLLASETSPHQRICMPKIAFTTLSIIGKWDSWELRQLDKVPEDSIRARWIKPEAPQSKMLLQIATCATKRPDQFFVLSVGKPSTCQLISKEAFEENPNPWPVFEIECKSLSKLKFNLGPLVLDMKFSLEGEFESAVAV